MQCPTDGTTLVMSERSGVEIDYCPQCRGVWLDRGELDKIIERAELGGRPAASPQAPQQPAQPQPQYGQPQYQQPQYGQPQYDDRSRGYGDGYHGKKKKRDNWLSDLFD
ncbi:zf-TFIIB domain-containing protein [Agromyces seonyuensis]|uniref:Transcription factor zinc-finger domain-containing protein n=1 Tax=Agromyces seonyuensis TaxID=2662446 RepID=A0A6I4P5G5_9MICO|nr:zf-TFIIB domain-containing protein [Agromyces seonyuensis]MWC00286.1 hypothetical protein [Agromyces seonyuensis]